MTEVKIGTGFRGSVFTQRTPEGRDYCDIEDRLLPKPPKPKKEKQP